MMERSVLAETRHVHWASELHSEYRSTYKWHDRTDGQQQPSGGVVKQPAPNPTSALPIARGPIEPAMPRRKKYPGVAYRANEFFDPAPADDIRPVQQWANDRARARTVQRAEVDRAGRRSKSEGPRQPRWTDTVEPKGSTATGDVQKRELDLTASTEYRNQFAWPKDTTDSAPRKSISMGALKKAAAAQGAVEAEPLISNEDHGDHGDSRPQKKFTNEYLWNNQKATAQRGKAKETKEDGEAREAMLASRGDDHVVKEDQQPMSLPTSDSWYQEVVDLRKRAGEYKYRGWGTELAPEHITQLYNKQIELWHQVSRRSSLSALSLANTSHKALPRDEKDVKDSKNQSPKKFRSFRSAPHQSIHSKMQDSKSTERSPHKSPQKQQKKKLSGQSFDEGSNKDNKGEFRSPRRRPRSADPAPVTKHLPNGHEPHPRPHKPTGLPLNKAGSTNKVRSTTSRGGRSPSAPGKPAPVSGQNGEIPGQRRSRSVSKVGIKLDGDIPSHRSASVAKDQYFDDSPIVKSPPEPTRVKSPEQMNMRSPDPVNWTVPLDTGKTFTVTQNVKSEIAPVHHQQMSPIRMKKSESPTNKRADKTPTTPISLTPIDETKALDINGINGHGINGVNGTTEQLTPENQEPKEVVKKSIEATQVAPGVVDTTLVNEPSTGGLTASEVLDRARNRFDKFWGKKEEDNV